MDIIAQEKKNNERYLPHAVRVQIFFSGRKLLLISGQKTVKEPTYITKAWVGPKARPRLIGHSMFTCTSSDTGRSRFERGYSPHQG